MTTSNIPPEHNNLTELQSLILRFAEERDWLQFHDPKNLSMAIAAEAAELLEQFLWVDGQGSLEKLDDSRHRKAIEEEVADVIILVMQFANVANIDLERVIRDKIDVNRQKYPVDLARGNSRKYNEL